MPCTDTSDLAKTLVRLARKLLGSPTVSNTLETVTFRDRDHVDDLVLLEDGADLDRLLEKTLRKLDLVRDGSTVHLDLHEVRLLLGETSLADLGVREDTDDSAVLPDALELTGDGLATVLGVLLGVAGERLLLRAVPVLVEPTLEFVRKVRSPDSGESTETARSLNIANNTDDNHRRSLNDCDRLDNLTLVHLWDTGSWSIQEDIRKMKTHWNQDGRGHERRGSYRPCNP